MSAGKKMVEGSCFSLLLFEFSHKTRKKRELFWITWPVKQIGSSCETESSVFHMGQN